ncbi:diacylglycerol/lipid kinase family protein [Reichenbachiella sp.]
MNKQHILFIINPIAGGGKPLDWNSLIHTHLDGSKFNYQIKYTQKQDDATKCSKYAVENNIEIVCAVGGDGTINEVAQGIVNSNTALAIIPRGSGNGLARHLSIPMNTIDAIKNLNHSSIYSMDACYLNRKLFLCVAGVGFDAHIAQVFDKYGKRGLISYAWLSFKEFFNYLPKRYKLITNEKEINTEAFLISFANASQFGNNAYIAPNAQTNDGLIDLIIIKPFPLWATLGILLRLFSRSIHRSKYCEAHSIKKLHMHSTTDIAHIDGEPVQLAGSTKISILPNSIKIVY